MKMPEADVVEVEPDVYSVLVDGVSFEARVTGNEVTIGSAGLLVKNDDPRRWKRSAGSAESTGHASLIAAMPGKIVRVLVAVGDEVAAGQGILVIEAMKMQNELKAPRAGHVAAIGVRENDSVNAGALLATIGESQP